MTLSHSLLGGSIRASGQPIVPYTLGNWTYISKPVYPIKINASQIPIGANWTYVYTLNGNSSYHVYFYGAWVDSNPLNPKTDYDVYVYDPWGGLESYHTEASGLTEHLGTTVEAPFFTPKYSGNYSFLIKNDPRESQGAKEGTFMLVEVAEGNRWYQRYIQGKVNDKPVENTSWAYEFVTTSKRVEVWIDVPETLDMFEARLYTMAIPSRGMGTFLNGVPLAWEPGLYGERDSSNFYGGYNLDSEGFRHTVAMASCEYPGKDMLINYTSPYAGDTLYHLVLIGEHGAGTIRFMVKTDFKPPTIKIQNPVEKVYTGRETTITANVCDEDSGLETVQLDYTRDNWTTWDSLEMAPRQNQTYVATIPGQLAGSTVKYRIRAYDRIGNIAEIKSQFVVKSQTTTSCSVSEETITIDREATVTGSIEPAIGNVTVMLTFTTPNGTSIKRYAYTLSDGTFSSKLKPDFIGIWSVRANILGDSARDPSGSASVSFVVADTWINQYKMYLIIAAAGGGAAAVGVFIYFRRRRG